MHRYIYKSIAKPWFYSVPYSGYSRGSKVTVKLYNLLSEINQFIQRIPLIKYIKDMGSNTIQVRPILSETIEKKGMQGWELLYQMQQTPWDLGQVTPAIQAFIDKGGLPQDVERILVPGCGIGYDVLAFAKTGATVTGLDLSSSAIDLANNLLKEYQSTGKLNHSEASRVEFVQGDFYSYSPKPFDMAFDYTFLCAMQPSMRLEWASQMSKVIRKGGFLLTLMFPISDHSGGPPFALSPQLYHDLLDGHFDLLWIQDDCPSVENRKGFEKLALWQVK
jgi:SAM-dependent methyltransferase